VIKDLAAESQRGRHGVRHAPLAVAGREVDVASASRQLANERHTAMGLVILRRPHVSSLGAGKPLGGPSRQIGDQLGGILAVPADRVTVAANQQQFFAVIRRGAQ
jgi:hypothetical protein